ncbi:MAG: hypothetical protein VYD19_02715 [Myxococcota bacterium]|nr:hypothetical protein [Myxococcota bacterium]
MINLSIALICVLLSLVACGSTAQKRGGGDDPLSNTGASEHAASPLDAILHQAAAQQAAEGEVQISWLISSAKPLSAGWRERPDPAAGQGLAEALHDAPPALLTRLSLHELDTASLPLDLQSLSESAPSELRGKLESAQRFFLLSYRGEAFSGDQQVRWLCTAARVLSDAGAVATQLGLQESFDQAGLEARCLAPWQGWVRPVGERVSAQALQLVTRGAAAYGRPDLESAPFSEEALPSVVPQFRTAVEALMTAPKSALRLGGRLASFQLAACERPRHHYEHRCLRLQTSPSP